MTELKNIQYPKTENILIIININHTVFFLNYDVKK